MDDKHTEEDEIRLRRRLSKMKEVTSGTSVTSGAALMMIVPARDHGSVEKILHQSADQQL